MKKPSSPKLSIHRETMRDLAPSALSLVQGGSLIINLQSKARTACCPTTTKY